MVHSHGGVPGNLNSGATQQRTIYSLAFSNLSCEKNILNDAPAAMWPAAMWLCHVSGPLVHCSMFTTDTQFVEWSKRFCDMSLEGSITSDEEDTYKEESPCGRWHRRNVKVNFI